VNISRAPAAGRGTAGRSRELSADRRRSAARRPASWHLADEGGTASADQDRREKQPDLVDQVGVVECAEGLAAALDQRGLDAARIQRQQQLVEPQPPARIRRQDQRLDALVLESRQARFGCGGGRCQERALALAAEDCRGRRGTRGRIQHDAQRVADFAVGAGRQRGIVSDDRAGADHDRIGAAPQFMALEAGLGAGDPAALAAGGGDASVERHRRLGDDVGPLAMTGLVVVLPRHEKPRARRSNGAEAESRTSRVPMRRHAGRANTTRPGSSSIRTMTVGSGIAPDPASRFRSARGLVGLRRITAGGDLHPAPKIRLAVSTAVLI
jgi:hypothetical protein